MFSFLSRVSAGDVIFFRRLVQQSNNFESAVLDVSTIDSDVFHVAMIVDENRIVHSVPDKGVCVETLASAIKDLSPDVIELGQFDTSDEHKQNALKFAINEAENGAGYNDLFAWDCVNSSKKRAFYCCQLIVFSYNSDSSHNQDLFLDHQLNFKNKGGEISSFWQDYYRSRGITTVPQGEVGSHPSKIRASPSCIVKALRCCSNTMEKLQIPSNFLKTLHFVGGAFTSLGSSANSFPVYEPRSGKLLTQINSASANEVEQAVLLAKEAQKKWHGMSWVERSAILRNVGHSIRSNHKLLAEWEVRE